MMCRPPLNASTIVFASLLLPCCVMAQPYPAKVVRLIVPFPAGAGVDTTTRVFTPKLSELLGQQFIVDNRGGAAGNIGAEAAARAVPDGYTLLVAPASLASSPSLYKSLPFDLVRDFDSVAMLASAAFVLAVHPSVPARNVRELIALAKAHPAQLTFASTGTGGTNHLAAELFKTMAHVDMIHVAYKGTATAIPDLLGGHVSLMFTSTLSSLPHVKTGRLRALGISSAKRSIAAPELPTVSESGVPGYESATWFAVLAPAKTPREIVQQLNQVIVRIGQSSEIRDRLLAQGAEPMISTPQQVSAFVKNEIVKWGKVIAAAGVKPD